MLATALLISLAICYPCNAVYPNHNILLSSLAQGRLQRHLHKVQLQHRRLGVSQLFLILRPLHNSTFQNTTIEIECLISRARDPGNALERPFSGDRRHIGARLHETSCSGDKLSALRLAEGGTLEASVEKVIEESLVKDMLGKVALDVVHESMDVLQHGGEDEVPLAESVVVRGEPRILLMVR